MHFRVYGNFRKSISGLISFELQKGLKELSKCFRRFQMGLSKHHRLSDEVHGDFREFKDVTMHNKALQCIPGRFRRF